MKTQQSVPYFILLLAMGALLLSACAGAPMSESSADGCPSLRHCLPNVPGRGEPCLLAYDLAIPA